MHFAFVLLKFGLGPIDKTLRHLSEITGIKESYVVHGDYDILTFIQADSMATLKHIIAFDIGKMTNIRSLLVLTVVTPTDIELKL